MKVGRRQVLLCTALIGTLLAVVLVEPPIPEEDVAAPARVVTADRKQEESSAGENVFGRLHRSDLPNSDKDPFRTESWDVAPPPPAEPTAPPLPFSYMGMFEDKGRATVYLARGDELFSVSVGERFAGSYRLEKVERGVLIIRYIPLSIRQTLPIGINE
jgi:hypothetical protein